MSMSRERPGRARVSRVAAAPAPAAGPARPARVRCPADMLTWDAGWHCGEQRVRRADDAAGAAALRREGSCTVS